MKLNKTDIEGLVILEPAVYGDERGYFMESFKADWFNENVCKTDFIQDNESRSTKGVLRGLHFQKPPFEQAKLVRVIEGEVLDVAVDLRKDSKTFGEHRSILLTGENKKQFFVPRGFAHGFVVLSDTATFSYKVDNVYSPECDAGLAFDDAILNIDWKVEKESLQLSAKDKVQPDFKSFKSPF